MVHYIFLLLWLSAYARAGSFFRAAYLTLPAEHSMETAHNSFQKAFPNSINYFSTDFSLEHAHVQ